MLIITCTALSPAWAQEPADEEDARLGTGFWVSTTPESDASMIDFDDCFQKCAAQTAGLRSDSFSSFSGFGSYPLYLDEEEDKQVVGPRTQKVIEEGELTVEEIAELMANPLSYLWFGMVQNDTYWYDGDLLDLVNEDKKLMNITMIQPVMSLQLAEEWKMIFRPVIPIHSFDTVQGFDVIESEPEGIQIVTDWDRKTGLGDIVLWTAFSNQYKPPLVYGFGPTIMMDTASREELGTGQWSAGPMGLFAYITDTWIFGCVAQHWWSITDRSTRDSVNLTDIQPLIRYRISQTTNVGIAPNIRYNWTADNDENFQLPLGGGISSLVMLGQLPVGWGLEYYYYLETPDAFGPEYQLRFFFTPVLPSPEWSRSPLF